MIEKVNTDGIVAIGLIGCLIAAIFSGMNELSMSIAGGLVGYMGRAVVTRKDDVK